MWWRLEIESVCVFCNTGIFRATANLFLRHLEHSHWLLGWVNKKRDLSDQKNKQLSQEGADTHALFISSASWADLGSTICTFLLATSFIKSSYTKLPVWRNCLLSKSWQERITGAFFDDRSCGFCCFLSCRYNVYMAIWSSCCGVSECTFFLLCVRLHKPRGSCSFHH